MHKSFCEIDWLGILNGTDLNSAVRTFHIYLYQSTEIFLSFKFNRLTSYRSWFDKEVKTLINAKKIVHKR